MSRLTSFVAAGLFATVAACQQTQPAHPTQAACEPTEAQARADRRDPQELLAYPAPVRPQPLRCAQTASAGAPAQPSPDDPMRLLDIP